jgi:hypothetical protein
VVTPELAVADGALGFWQAIEQVWPQDARPALLGTQDRQRAQPAAEEPAVESQARTALVEAIICLKIASLGGPGILRKPEREAKLFEEFSQVFFRKLSAICVFAVNLLTWVPTASSGSPLDGRAEYVPIQSMSYDFGSKSMSGYFVQRGSTCSVTLMIIEKSDPKMLRPVTASRVRLALNLGQIAGLDSEEGRSLNFTCGEGAATLVVDFGERSKLVAAEALAVPKTLAEEP